MIGVDPALFAAEMQTRWLTWNPVVSPSLLTAWSMFAEIFNEQAYQTDGGPRPVIPAELGAGKTTAAKRRGWNMRAGYWYAQLAAEASPRPCWRTN